MTDSGRMPGDRCPICRSPARRIKIANKSLFDIDCGTCCMYRIGGTFEARMLAMPSETDRALVPRIAAANARGWRLDVTNNSEIGLESSG